MDEQVDSKELRRKAERKLKRKKARTGAKSMSEADFPRLVHELEVHQIELEMQNEELRRLQEVLEQSRAEHADFYDFAPVGYVTLDERGVILNANPTACAELGVERFRLRRKPFAVFVLKELKDTFRFHLQRVFETRERQTCGIGIKGKNGPVWYAQLQSIAAGKDEKGAAMCRTTITDITERKRAEEALRASEARYRALFEQSPDGVVIIDPPTSRILEFNETAHQQLGYSREEFARLCISDIDALETPEKTRARIQKVLSGDRERFETLHRTRQGEIRIVHVTAQIIQVLERPVYHCIWRDITNRKRAEESLLDYRERLRSLASELSATEERERCRLATYLHDDLGQVLALAKIRLGELQSLPLSDDAHRLVEEAKESTTRAIERTRSVTHELFPAALHQFGLSAALEVLAEEIEKTTKLPVAFQEDDAPKPLNMEICTLLYRGVREALFNVVKHAQAKQAHVCVRRVGDAVEVLVEDDGTGFDFAEVQSRTGKTHGVGLFSSTERLRYVGGQLLVDSAPGQGARVILRAPLERAGAAGAGEA